MAVDLYCLLDLTPEGVHSALPSLTQGETVACVHGVFTDCWVRGVSHLCAFCPGPFTDVLAVAFLAQHHRVNDSVLFLSPCCP